MVNISKALLEDLRCGRVVLFLGAGASVGARNKTNENPPLGDALRDKLVDRFLVDKYRNRSLAVVASYAISEAGSFVVQDFVANLFDNLIPADFHYIIPKFRWKGIVTTNYDRVIESIYTQNHDGVQELIPIYSDEDRVDEKIRSCSQLPLLKLHGCITITHREDLPLILTADQYADCRKNRRFLYQRLEGWANEYPIIFVGHKLEDSDVLEVLKQFVDVLKARPRYYMIDPDSDDIASRYWDERRVSVLKCTFEDFLRKIDSEISVDERGLAQNNIDHPIGLKISLENELPPRMLKLLNDEVEYVYSGISYEQGNPSAFFRGFDLGWYPIREDIDVRRDLIDVLLTDVIIRPEEDRPIISELYVVKSEAGSGKSVLLRRLAWESSVEADVLVFMVRKYGVPMPEDIAELQRIVNQRIFLIWDNAADNVGDIEALMQHVRSKLIPITVIVAERSNEWNMGCESLEKYLVDRFELEYLNEGEINDLILKLETYNCLGPNLKYKDYAQRMNEFKFRAGRQLLVALHEATMGISFEEITGVRLLKILITVSCLKIKTYSDILPLPI